MNAILAFLLLCAVPLLSFPANAAPKHSASKHSAPKHIAYVVSPQTLELKPGETTTLKVIIRVDEGWYTYGFTPRVDKDGLGPQATEISLAPQNVLRLAGKIQAPPPKQKFDQGFQMTIDYYEGEVAVLVPVKASKTLAAGRYQATLTITSMVCYASGCLPATDEEIPLSVVISGSPQSASAETDEKTNAGTSNQANDTASATTNNAANNATTSDAANAQTATAGTSPGTTESQAEIQQKRQEGFWAFLLFAMGAGASALLTPCVFPMVPITVSFFTKRAESQNGRGVRDSLVYALGIILTFTALGFILSLFFGATGISDFAANPWVNIFLAALFLFFAFNLFGAFEIPLPTGLLNKMNNAAGSGQSVGAVILMAITFSITSFTCTVPFVGAALVSASAGEWFYPIVGMAGFSAVFALPFVLLALFPSAMQRLPKAGGWMNNVKVVMGFLEIAAAMKFISNSDLVWAWGILSRDVFLATWIACGVMITLYILGVFRFAHDAPVSGIGAPRAAFALFFAALTFYLVGGFLGKKLGELDAFLPPADYERIINPEQSSLSPVIPSVGGARAAGKESLFWRTNYEAALEEARKTGKPLFLDFTGFTCTNCRWMEANIFPLPEVQGLLGDMITVQLFTDRKQEPYISNRRRQLEQFGSIELPLYVVLKPDGSVVATKAFTRDKAEFVEFLRKAL
jgi:thiol:disulfide interchange protein DsbD